MTKDKLIKKIATIEISELKKSELQQIIKEAQKLTNLSKKKYKIPVLSEVEEYFTQKGDMMTEDISLEAQKFINHYEERSWKTTDGKRIKSWKRQASTWNINYQKYNKNEKRNRASIRQTRGDRQIRQYENYLSAN